MIEKSKNALSRLLPSSGFARGVSVLVGGTAGAQILLLLAAPMLARFYTPEDFGLFGVYGSLLAIICVVASLRYELAIPLPEDDHEAANVVILCLLLLAVTSLLTAVLGYFLGDPLAILLGVPKLADYFWLLPVGVFFSGAYSVFSYWGIRTKKFSSIAGAKLKQVLVMLVIQLLAFKLGVGMLVFGQVAGQGVSSISLAMLAVNVNALKNMKWHKVITAAFLYKKFPQYSTWGGLLNSVGAQLPTILIAAFFSPVAAGCYVLANKVIFYPASVIQDAISNVLLSASNSRNDGISYSELIKKTHSNLIKISAPISSVLFLFSPYVFGDVFGDAWVDAGKFAKWLSVMLFFQFVSSPLSVIFHALYRPELTLLINGVMFFLRMLGLWVGYINESALVAIILFSLLSSIGYIIFTYWTTRVAGVNRHDFFKNNVNGIFVFIASMIFPVVMLNVVESYLPALAVSILTASMYYLYIYKRNFLEINGARNT